jgi:hypothetical protein
MSLAAGAFTSFRDGVLRARGPRARVNVLAEFRCMDGRTGSHANPILFEAVRVLPAKGEEALAFRLLRAMRSLGRFGGAEPPAFTYAALDPEPFRGEKRAHRRTRTRLRTGKLVDRRDAFLTECRFHDRSRVGARLELLRAVDLPDGLRLFEDETGLLFAIRLVWRDRRGLGVALDKAVGEACAALGRSHYALR